MKITLISTATFPSDQGIRQISSVLKKEGHFVKVIFLKFSEDYSKFYSSWVLKEILRLCNDSDLIGINSFASTAPRAIQVIRYLKGLENLIVWGGIHATISPEKCIEECDIVAVGECESAIVDLVKCLESGDSITGIPNLWVRSNKKVFKNPVRDLIDDLDSLPPADYDIENHYILDKGRLRKFKEEDLNGEIFFLTGRGCPYGCAYCSNDLLNKLYKGKRKKIVRHHSPEYIINCILDLKSRFKTLHYFDIRDDTFAMRSLEDIRKFCKLYKSRVGMRFKCLTDPKLTSDEKIRLLVDAGCTDIIVGIQGVERVNKEIYHRNQADAEVLKAGQILNKYKDRLAVMYDVITCNPYESPQDVINMIRLLQKIPKPYFLSVNNLVFFTQTPLYCKAVSDGIIKCEEDSAANLNYWDRASHIKLKKKNMYLNLILNMMRGSVTESRFGPMPNLFVNYLLDSKRVEKNLKNTFRTRFALVFVGFSDLVRERVAKPVFRSMPLGFRIWYDRVRYRV